MRRLRLQSDLWRGQGCCQDLQSLQDDHRTVNDVETPGRVTQVANTDHTIPLVARRLKRLLTALLLASVYICILFYSTPNNPSPIEITAFSLLLAAVLIVLSIIDIETFSLPDPLVITLAVGGVVTCLVLGSGTLLQHSLAALAVGLLIVAVNLVYLRVRGRHGIGMGDAKFLAAGAIWVGASGILTAVLWACLTGLTHCLGVATLKKELSGNLKIPFGPHIALGIWLVWLFGPVV